MIYDYQCRDCTEIFEQEHSMNFNGLVECPVCGSYNTARFFLEVPAIKLAWWNDRARHKDLTEQLNNRYRPAAKRKERKHESK